MNYTGTGTCPASGTLAAFARVDVSGCSVGDTITVSEGTPGVSFRQWYSNYTDQYAFLGYSNSPPSRGTIRGEVTQMPPMNSFTTDATGTTAGDNFFSMFNSFGSLVSLSAGSFDTSKITTTGMNFFSSFNSNGALTSLPAGSFNTSKITTSGGYFFYSFNSNNGKLVKSNTGIPIKNTSSSSVNFQSWNGSSSDITAIASGDTFEFYGVNKLNYSVDPGSGDLTGGTIIGITDEGTLIQLPTSATRVGYMFVGFTSNSWTGIKNLGETFTLTQDVEITTNWTKSVNPTPEPAPTPVVPSTPNYPGLMRTAFVGCLDVYVLIS